ncbi:hypothetical protein EVA_05237 [gut metagenome]|uniref:Uncharacterized protein n=1 Tax=gut metagenome TaxID=749906 RepID=J9H069_9ZZZZ
MPNVIAYDVFNKECSQKNTHHRIDQEQPVGACNV